LLNWGVLVYNHHSMDEPRFYRRPWVYTFGWALLMGIIYLWQVRRMGGFMLSLVYIFIDGFLFVVGLLLWLAFFAQFVLPVRSFADRQKIFERLLGYISGWRGPAIFIRDGVPIERQGEEKRTGPGVLWLDSASAAVTRTPTAFKQTLGPGVHFTDYKESLAGVLDLHKQVQKLGPPEGEDPFARKGDGQSQDVSAWTRDGVEVVPTLSVVFQIDAFPALGIAPGSHFADLTPYSGENEKGVPKNVNPEDNPIFKAIAGEGVNPRALSEDGRQVKWNQLPARIAVDLWREYLAKFTLKQLFEAGQEPLPSEPVDLNAGTRALYQPASHLSSGGLAGMLHEFNSALARMADDCETRGKKPIPTRREIPRTKNLTTTTNGPQLLTALQVINQMILARMTQRLVVELDDQGQQRKNRQGNNEQVFVHSKEYDILKGRGLRIHAVTVSNLNLNPTIEQGLVNQWKATWLQNAMAEKAQIDRLRSYAEIKAQVDGKLEYALSIGKCLEEEEPPDIKATVQTLLLRSRNELVKNDRFHRRASLEREALEEIIQWIERNGP